MPRSDRVDLDELARLEEERDFLLRSIEDLDREHDAGDVDDADYRELRDGYVARAADAIRAVESGQSALERQRAERPRRLGRVVAWVGGVLLFTVGAGVLLAGALGSRGDGDTLTGTGAMPDSASSQCRTESFKEPAKGVTCYAKILEDSPDDIDALTYQGWAMVRSGDVEGGSANFDRVVEVDPSYADVHVFRASVAKDAGDFVAAQAELDQLYALNPSPLVISTMQQMGLDRTIAVGLLPTDVAACWGPESDALDDVVAATGAAKPVQADVANALADVAISLKCLDTVLAARPADADALTLRSLGMGVLGFIDEQAVNRAEADVTSALAARPDDPTALLLRAVWRDRLGRFDEALADIVAVDDRRISPLIETYVPTTNLKATIEADRAAAAQQALPGSTTTTP